ncbi:unnamed protein product [Bemisia tabaci]|uniref:Uncharacterized protein n=1 Tax=Bemisia tabaci TaxID=7038 RepID=A0A9P0F878_BEMTA|nr:unnamed protein product [Bemisia tabaci]
MSSTLESYDTILAMVMRYCKQGLETYFSKHHMDILKDMVREVLGQRSFRYVETNVVLVEPIVTNKGIIFFSIPMIAQLINQPVNIAAKVSFVSKFDIFESITVKQPGNAYDVHSDNGLGDRSLMHNPFNSTFEFNERKRKRFSDEMIQSEYASVYNPSREKTDESIEKSCEILNSSDEEYSSSNTNGESSGTDDSEDENEMEGRNSEKEDVKDFIYIDRTNNAFNASNSFSCDTPLNMHGSYARDSLIVSVVQILRLTLLVSHWSQHCARNIPFKTHEGFEELEFSEKIIRKALKGHRAERVTGSSVR